MWPFLLTRAQKSGAAPRCYLPSLQPFTAKAYRDEIPSHSSLCPLEHIPIRRFSLGLIKPFCKVSIQFSKSSNSWSSFYIFSHLSSFISLLLKTCLSYLSSSTPWSLGFPYTLNIWVTQDLVFGPPLLFMWKLCLVNFIQSPCFKQYLYADDS